MNGAKLLVKCLEENGIRYIYAIPGAKVDAIFDALVDSKIRLIICRHEQNAVFMAQAEGRLSGKPGVVLVTSGPGVSNLVTGLLTATTEGDPVIAIGGNAERRFLHHKSHQSAHNTEIMHSVVKFNQEVLMADDIPAAVSNAYRHAMQTPRGSSFLSIPVDVSHELAQDNTSPVRYYQETQSIKAHMRSVEATGDIIQHSKKPVLFLGQEASRVENYALINKIITDFGIPAISTLQAAGCVSHKNKSYFIGRVGLTRNQPGDVLLQDADVVITIGFDPVEYDPEVWNIEHKRIIYINVSPVDIHSQFQPEVEVLGNIQLNLDALHQYMKNHAPNKPVISKYQALFNHAQKLNFDTKDIDGMIHPLCFVHTLAKNMTKDTIISCDIGSHGMWIDRYLMIHHPHHLLVSNGQQTLGVGLPWAISCRLMYPDAKIISISGDGGFLYSATELETAVRYQLPFVHIVVNSKSYDMVKTQQLLKYERPSGVELGSYDIIKFAESFGAHGYHVTSTDELDKCLGRALTAKSKVPKLIMFDVNYRDNLELFRHTIRSKMH